MRRILITMLMACLLSPFIASAQSWEAVKGSDAYLWGEGKGATVAEADKQALNDLISKISLHISSTTYHNETETAKNEGVELNSTFSSVVNTYSAATLTNTEKRVLKNEPDAHVGRWIKRSELSKIFESRKLKIADYISSALKAESQGKIDVALKDLYWALALTTTLQYPNEYRYVDEEGERESFMAVTWIPRHINEIFENLRTYVVNRKGDELELYITYDNKPVTSIDYTFFDGRDWSNIYSAKDGVGVLELAPGSNHSNYQLKWEYEFRGEAHVDKEVDNVLNSINAIPMRGAYKTVKTDAKNGKVQSGRKAGALNSFASVPAAIFAMPEPLKDSSKYRDLLKRLSSAIVRKQYDEPGVTFTSDGREIYDALIKYGNAKIVGSPEWEFYKYGNDVVARGLLMSFSFKSGMRKSFVEEVVFTFNDKDEISNIAFGLGKTAETDILGKGVWDEGARFAIMNFLENYQTAYALKRLDYISSIFDDDAVIITGTVIKAPRRYNGGDVNGTSFSNDIIRYNRHTKDSYLRQLKNSFAGKEYINIRFAGNDVRKLGKGGELYAIQISQEYYSSNYGDKGYLFLMVDINDPASPIIKVRTWQPEKDPDFGIYGPEHFK